MKKRLLSIIITAIVLIEAVSVMAILPSPRRVTVFTFLVLASLRLRLLKEKMQTEISTVLKQSRITISF